MSGIACATVDLDPVRVYLENRGLEAAPRTRTNAVYEGGLRRFLELFAQHGVHATFFVVGREVPPNAALLRQAVAAGHELASHGLTHRLDLATAGPAVMERELATTEALLDEHVGVRVRGFRAPGWNVSRELFARLAERGYRYDSSLVPLPGKALLATLPRLVPGWSGPAILGGQRWWPRPPAHPYPLSPARPWAPPRRPGERARLWEVPCGVASGVPVPLSATASALLGDRLCRLTERFAARSRAPLVFVFHGLDLVDFDTELRDPRLVRKPGLTAPLATKLRRINRILGVLGARRTWLPLDELVSRSAA